jgi:hypothetical protein
MQRIFSMPKKTGSSGRFMPFLLGSLILAVIGILYLPSTTADVTSPEYSIDAHPKFPLLMQLDIDSIFDLGPGPDTSIPIAGLNGQINYDPAFFSSASVATGHGAPGFIVQGHEVSPGQFRFVSYANPTKTMNDFNAVLEFRLEPSVTIQPNSSTLISYSMEAASDTNGVSLDDDQGTTLSEVMFGAVTVNYNNSVLDWADYR